MTIGFYLSVDLVAMDCSSCGGPVLVWGGQGGRIYVDIRIGKEWCPSHGSLRLRKALTIHTQSLEEELKSQRTMYLKKPVRVGDLQLLWSGGGGFTIEALV